MRAILRKLYLSIGIHTAPPGTFLYALHHKFVALVRATLSPSNLASQPTEVEYFKVSGRYSPIVTVRRNSTYHFPIKKIAIVKGDHIGDLVLSIPAIEMLKKRFPDAAFTLICNEWNRGFAVATGLFERVVVAPLDTEARKGASRVEQMEVMRILSALPSFDMAIDMKIESGTRYTLRAINAQIKVGFYADTMPLENSIILPQPPAVGQSEGHKCSLHNRELLCMLSNAIITRFNFEQEDAAQKVLKTLADNNKVANDWGDHKGPIVGINTGAGCETKCWPVGHYVLLCQELIRLMDARIVIFGTGAQSRDALKIISQAGHDNIKNMTGKLSLTDFISTVPELDLFIGHDTGSTHIAAAIGCPTLCLFSGITSYERFAPMGKNVTVVRSHMPCSPCGIFDVKDCRHHHACMEGITVNEVTGTIMSMLPLPMPILLSKSSAHEVETEHKPIAM